MKNMHRVSLSVDYSDHKIFADFGVAVGIGFQSILLEEEKLDWNGLKEYLDYRKAVIVSHSEFSKAEMSNASFFRMFSTWHHGYPSPEDELDHPGCTYDLSSYDPSSGIGKRQVDSFRLIKEPKLGRNDFLQINWIFDEFFVRKEIYERYFAPMDIGAYRVKDRKGKVCFDDLVQLKSQGFSGLSEKVFRSAVHDPHQSKFEPITLGIFPSLDQEPENLDYFKTEEYFGSGSSAWNAVIVSRKVYDIVIQNKLKGVDFVPLRSTSGSVVNSEQ